MWCGPNGLEKLHGRSKYRPTAPVCPPDPEMPNIQIPPEPEATVTNAELADAITRAQALMRQWGTADKMFATWASHIDALLQIQRDRAASTVPVAPGAK